MVKTKLKPILPSLREKKRYLAFEVISNHKKPLNEVEIAIQNSVLSFMGQLGAAKAGIMVLSNKWNHELQRGIIKVNNKHIDNLKAALAMTNHDNTIFRSIGVSGVLRKSEEKYLNEV